MSDHGNPVAGRTPDQLDRRPGETSDEHEMRLHRDFGIRIPDFPLDGVPVAPMPPDMTLELLTHIRDLLSQLVASQARPAVNLTNISQTLADDPAKLWESLKGVDKETFRKKLFGEIAEGSEHLDVRGPQSVGHPGELDQRIGQDRDLLDEAVDDLLRRRGLSGHPLAQRFSRLLDDAIEIFANLVRESHDETPPSVDGCGDPTVGDGPVAEVSEEPSATAATDTPAGIDTSPLVVHRTASLQDAISARDDVFFRIRNIAAQPPSEFAYEQLPMLVEELRVEQLQVNRCTAQLEHARAAEVSRGEAGMFSNRRRPGTRFSNPTPPAAPETPDTAQ